MERSRSRSPSPQRPPSRPPCRPRSASMRRERDEVLSEIRQNLQEAEAEEELPKGLAGWLSRSSWGPILCGLAVLLVRLLVVLLAAYLATLMEASLGVAGLACFIMALLIPTGLAERKYQALSGYIKLLCNSLHNPLG